MPCNTIILCRVTPLFCYSALLQMSEQMTQFRASRLVTLLKPCLWYSLDRHSGSAQKQERNLHGPIGAKESWGALQA